MIKVINVQEKFEAFNDYWNPRIVGELNGQQVKLARFKGEFTRHKHEDEDELFWVIEGRLFIELYDRKLELNPGEFVVIPKGTYHKPIAPAEVKVMLFEPKSTLNTGDQQNQLTKKDLEDLS